LEEIDVLGDHLQDQGLVFCTSKGTLINPTNLRKRSFAPLLVRAGLPHITFHQLRHTAATILLLKNVNPKIVSEMLGHASIAITLDTLATSCRTCRIAPSPLWKRHFRNALV
jgi:integrase